jgi:hypothetical protein
MLKTIAVHQLRPNPFRRLDEYPIIREKVDALKESIAQTGFWGTIVGRPVGENVEIAFGHHRLVALQEGAIDRVEVIVKDLSNEQMLKMMARENMEEWGTSAWVELETIRAVIEAYGKGEIALPKIPSKANESKLRYACQDSGTHPYTESTVAEFLGWTRKAHGDGLRPNYACETAFKALDMIDDEFLAEVDLKGLKRSQLADLVKEQWSIYQAEMRVAEQNRKEATRAQERAAKTEAPVERQIFEKQAKVYTEQAEQHKAAAKEKATTFGKEGAGLFRDDRGRDAVKARAAELKPVVERPAKVHNLDDLADRIAERLEAFSRDETLIGDFKLLKANIADVSPVAINGLRQSFALLIDTLERMQGQLPTPSRSHTDGTVTNHDRRKAIVEKHS